MGDELTTASRESFARQLVDHGAAFHRVMDETRADLITDWEREQDPVKRETIWQQLQGLEAVKRKIRTIVDDVKLKNRAAERAGREPT